MGRPLNKRYFGNNADDNISARAFVPGGGDDEAAMILSQSATNEYRVRDINGVEGTCELVFKADAALLEGEMNIPCVTDSGNALCTKLYNRTCRVDNAGPAIGWTFVVDGGDGLVQLIDVVGVIITVQPADSVSSSGGGTFAVTTNGLGGEAFQWEVNLASGAQGAGDWQDAVGAIEGVTYTNDTTATLTYAGAAGDDDGNIYRVTITATDAFGTTSNNGLLTFGD